jgi:hypothetical protein
MMSMTHMFSSSSDLPPRLAHRRRSEENTRPFGYKKWSEKKNGQVKAMNAHQARRRWGHMPLCGWAKLAIDRRCLAGGGHSALSAPPRAVDGDPDEADALLEIHFMNPSAGWTCLKSYMRNETGLFACFTV